MEIIHLILGKANPQRMNGVNKVVHTLATRQTAAGMAVQVWGMCFHPVHDYPARKYQTLLFARSRNPVRLDRSLKAAMKKLDKKNYVFHLHGGFIPQMWAASRILSRLGIPYVFTPHGSYNRIAMQRNILLKKFYFHLLEKRLVRGAGAVHSLGKSEVEGLQAIYPHANAVLIPYGFDLPEAAVPDSDTGQFVIGYCGRLDAYTKGLDELILGFDLFYASHSNARLWIIGDSPERERLEKLAASRVSGDAITFWGARYGNEKIQLLEACQIIAAPSRNEGLPTAVLEACSLGKPCLVTEATNTGDYIRAYDAGVVIAGTNEQEIQGGLERMYKRMEDSVARIGFHHKSRRMIAEGFDWNQILVRFNNMYLCQSSPTK